MLTEKEIEQLDVLEKMFYKNIVKQIQFDSHIHRGKQLCANIVSDRCLRCAAGIWDYLRKKTGMAGVEYFHNYKKAKEYIELFAHAISCFSCSSIYFFIVASFNPTVLT